MGAFRGKEGLASVHQEVPDSPPLYLAGHRHVTLLSQLVTPLRRMKLQSSWSSGTEAPVACKSSCARVSHTRRARQCPRGGTG